MNGNTLVAALMVAVFAIAIIVGFAPTDKDKKETPVEKVEPNYNVGTPAYDLMTVTNSKTIKLGNKQKAVIVGVDVISLWLENASNKEIVSITTFNRGLQGSTSSFFIVYWEK